MVYVVLVVGFVLAIIVSFMAGFNFAMRGKAKDMIEKMHMGTIILDTRDDANETIQCQFDKSPRELLNMDFILMEVKIRR